MPKITYDPKKHGNKLIEESNAKLKNAFIYYMANQIYLPKLKDIYDYSSIYDKLKNRFLPKQVDLNYKNLRQNWSNEVFLWIQQSYLEVIKFGYKKITDKEISTKEISTKKFDKIKKNFFSKESDLYKEIKKISGEFSSISVTLADIQNLSKIDFLNTELKNLLIDFFLLDYISYNLNDFNLNENQAIDFIVKLYNDNKNKTNFPFYEIFIKKIQDKLREEKFVSSSVSRHILAKISDQNINLGFNFKIVNKENYTLKPNELQKAIDTDLTTQFNANKKSKGHWENKLSKATIKLIKKYGLYHEVINGYLNSYKEFNEATTARTRFLKAKELYNNYNPMFINFDIFINNILNKFGEFLLKKRNSLKQQFPLLLYYHHDETKNYITILKPGFQFDISNYEELITSFQLTIRSFQRLYKFTLQEAYFYPCFTMKDIADLESRNKQFKIVKEDFYLPNTSTYIYSLKGLGIVPVNFRLKSTGVIDPYVPDFGQYLNDIKSFEKLKEKKFTNQDFFSLLKLAYQVKTEEIYSKLKVYTNNSMQQQILMQKIALIVICLFIAEGIRNKGSLIVNLINLCYACSDDKELPLADQLTTYFPMIKKDASNIGRSLEHLYNPMRQTLIGKKAPKIEIDKLIEVQSNSLNNLVNCKNFVKATKYIKNITFFSPLEQKAKGRKSTSNKRLSWNSGDIDQKLRV